MHRIFWALLVIGVIAVLMHMDWIYYLIYVVGGVWAFSHWWVRRSLRHLSVERRMSERAFTGEMIDVVVEVRNRSWLPVAWLHLREAAPLDLKDQPNYTHVLSVGGHARTEYRYRLRCKRRGYYQLGPLSLATGDLFGFAGASWQETAPPHVTVYPRVVPLHELGLPSRLPIGALGTPQRLFEDPARLSGVRAYQSGDSLRRIHWKASAHEDTLLVKKFQPAISLMVTIVLDLNGEAYPLRGKIGYSEWAIVVAASLANHVIQQRQAVGLITNGWDPAAEDQAAPIAARQGQGQLMNLLSLLARIQLRTVEEPLAEWLPRHIGGLIWGTTLIVVTPNLSEPALWALHGAYRRGSNVLALVCAPQVDFRLRRSQGERLGVAVHRTIWEEDLKTLA